MNSCKYKSESLDRAADLGLKCRISFTLRGKGKFFKFQEVKVKIQVSQLGRFSNEILKQRDTLGPVELIVWLEQGLFNQADQDDRRK